MKVLTLFYAIPAVVFLVMAGLWYLGRGLPRVLAVLPVVASYGMAGALLFLGGCKPVAHVILDGMEIDLVDASGALRDVSLGEEPPAERQLAGIPVVEVPGYPEDALRVGLDNGRLKLKPGTGYERGLLVMGGDDELIPLEPKGYPLLLPMEGGDEIEVKGTAGGDVVVQWRLGVGSFDLTPSERDFRWIGTAGSGIAKLTGIGERVLGIRSQGGLLTVKRGGDLPTGMGVMVNGLRLNFNDAGEAMAPYKAGKTLLALVQTDAAVGKLQFVERGVGRFFAELNWQSVRHDPPPGYPLRLESGRRYRVGGAVEDDVFVGGLPVGALVLEVSGEGELKLEVGEAGKDAWERGELRGRYPQTVSSPDQALQVGVLGDRAGGQFFLMADEAVTAPPEVTVAEESDEAAAGDEAVSESGSVEVVPVASGGKKEWTVVWVPNVSTQWLLENRRIVVPLVNFEVPLGQRRPWRQAIFPLGAVTPRASSLRSAVVYGQAHEAWINGANLLLVEDGVELRRGGQVVSRKPGEVGLLPGVGSLDFMMLRADVQGGLYGAVYGRAWSPAQVWDGKRVAMQRRFGEFALKSRQLGTGRTERAIPVLSVKFAAPIKKSIPLAEVEADLKEIDEGSVKVEFGVNDQAGLSKLPHQVFFQGVTRSMSSANADVELNWLSFNVQDDFRKMEKLSYGEPFKIGDDKRLLLRVETHGRPLGLVLQTVLVGLIATAVCAWGAGSFGWVSLMFGASFLSCSRLLFAQAVVVNPPYNEKVMTAAWAALWLVPVVLGVFLVMGKLVLPGKLEKALRKVEEWISFRRLMLLAVLGLLLRVLLLGLGFKEAIPLPWFRLAFSVFFVPAYICLFGMAFFILWREKHKQGWLDWKLLLPFILCALVLTGCQGLTAVLVSDLGMMLYFIPQALLLAGVGLVYAIEGGLGWLRETHKERREKGWQVVCGVMLPTLPLTLIAIVFLAPGWLMGVIPGMSKKLSVDSEEVVTDSTLLRVLQFTNKDYLINLGTDAAERIAQDHAIMENYAHRGLLGVGYLNVNVVPAKYVTALNDNVSGVFVLAQFGVLGGLAVLVAYMAVAMGGGARRDSSHSVTQWLALVSGLSFCLISVYMIAANYGLLPFTGRNLYLLGLDSWSDVAESLALLGLIVLHECRTEFHEESISTDAAASLDLEALVGPRGGDEAGR
jgi:hypothetical protein